MKNYIVYLLFLVTAVTTFAQKQLEKELSESINPEELVTLSENIPFDQAIEVLSGISEKLTGKKIVSTVPLTTPIGIEIDKMPYMKALLIIVQYNNLVYEERETVIVVKSKIDPTSNLAEDIYAPVTGREVKISALFFEANTGALNEQGINWEVLLSNNGFNVGSNLITFAEQKESQAGNTGQQDIQKTPEFTVGPKNSEFNVGDWQGTATALFKFFETEDLGEVIANPSVVVRDKNKGRIQIGSDISIKQRDFAGNVTDVFISTGTIVEVTPYIYTEDGLDYVLLKIKVERSNAKPDPVSTEIFKTTASTEVLMLNGEETVIGGLFINEQTTTRRGIPILKDLPWWVLGIRYLAGYNADQTLKKEEIILIKADILPTLKERVAAERKNILRDELKKGNDYIEGYKAQYKAKNLSENAEQE